MSPIEEVSISSVPIGEEVREKEKKDELQSELPDRLQKMMSSYFLEYASYVIKDRAIPYIDDGLKPVQRRILYSLWEIDDGTFHKVAHVVGHTMKYHPHGDASIYQALVYLANKDLFITKQGNFGNTYTGDTASAPRYIECKLSAFSQQVLFHHEITNYVSSYDDKNVEPTVLPAKVPVLLLLGSEGIAVGMNTKILPHNFAELLQAQIAIIRKRSFHLVPDFPHGGILDVSNYQGGNGTVRIRANILTKDVRTLVIRELPYGITTESLIDSIEDAVQKGKIKLSAVNDYTAEDVEIELLFPRGTEVKQVIQALYAYTNCEVTLYLHCLVIDQHQPRKMTVEEILHHNTEKLMQNFQHSLDLERERLERQYHDKKLTYLFIFHHIYKKIEKCRKYKSAVGIILKELTAVLPPDDIVHSEDVEKLLNLPIRKITQCDFQQIKREMKEIIKKKKEVERSLKDIPHYTIVYLQGLLETYGKKFPRKTKIAVLESVDLRKVAQKKIRVGWDKKNGYIGMSITAKHQLTCTEHDRLVIIKKNGSYTVTTIAHKRYIDSAITILVWEKERVYSLVYQEHQTGLYYAKKFQISNYTIDRKYRVIPGDGKIVKLFDRQGVVLRCGITRGNKGKKESCELDFSTLPVTKSTAKGNKISRYPIESFSLIKRGSKTNLIG